MSVKDAVATPIGDIYRASSAPGEPDVYAVVATVDENTNTHSIPWSAAKRADDKLATTGAGDTGKTTFAGSVRGLAGTFSCTGANCTPPVPVNGAITSGGTWTFVPTVADDTIDVDDEDYLQFGWWLNMKGDDVEAGFDVQTFASAPDMMESTELVGDTVEGSATYTGGAGGQVGNCQHHRRHHRRRALHRHRNPRGGF